MISVLKTSKWVCFRLGRTKELLTSYGRLNRSVLDVDERTNLVLPMDVQGRPVPAGLPSVHNDVLRTSIRSPISRL